MGRERAGATTIGVTLESGGIEPIVGTQYAIGGPSASIVGPQFTLDRAIVFAVRPSIGRA